MRRLSLLVNTILPIILLGIIYSFVNFYQGTLKKVTVSPGKDKRIKVKDKPLSYYSIIEKKNIFSLSSPFKPITSLPAIKKEVNLELKGTVVGKKEFSFAVIEEKKSHRQDLYRIGDTIDEMEIVAIKKNEVILKSNEGIVSLTLSEPTLSHASSPEIRVVTRKEIEEAKRNINQIFSQIRISPFFKDGKMKGFKVNYIVPGSIVEKMGIRKGDIIKKVNGEMIDSPSKIFELYHKFSDSNRIVVMVERNGRNESLVYQMGG